MFSATKDSSPCNSTLMISTDCERQIASGCLAEEERATARLQCQHQREQEGRQLERTEVRQARLDRRSVHGEESVVFSGSIGIELVHCVKLH